MDINTVCLSGNLTSDPEVRSLPSGQAVARLRLAVNGSKKDENGDWVKVPNFFDVSVFGAPAEWCGEHSKGARVTVHGRLQWREWEDGDGNKRQAVDVIAKDIELPKGARPATDTSGEPDF